MQGDQRLSHIIFKSGVLMVSKTKTVLQKLLSIYHPMNNILYTELKPEVKAASQIDVLEMESCTFLEINKHCKNYFLYIILIMVVYLKNIIQLKKLNHKLMY